MTMSHSALPPFEIEKQDPKWWDEVLTWGFKFHSDFFKILVGDTVEKKKSTIFFTRFEDLLSQPEKELTGLFKYLLDLEDLSGTNIERRIKLAISMGAKASTLYALKKNTGKKNAHVHRYSDAQIERIKYENADNLFFFGYAHYNGQGENPTDIFKFDNPSTDLRSKDYGFRKVNEEMIKEVIKVSKDPSLIKFY